MRCCVFIKANLRVTYYNQRYPWLVFLKRNVLRVIFSNTHHINYLLKKVGNVFYIPYKTRIKVKGKRKTTLAAEMKACVRSYFPKDGILMHCRSYPKSD